MLKWKRGLNNMREKYIDERWPLLMVHGCLAGTKQPCVTDSDDNVNLFMQDMDQAVALVNHYNKLHGEFTALIQAFDAVNPEAFNEFWYNRERS